jgi:hypothetical protein
MKITESKNFTRSANWLCPKGKVYLIRYSKLGIIQDSGDDVTHEIEYNPFEYQKTANSIGRNWMWEMYKRRRRRCPTLIIDHIAK